MIVIIIVFIIVSVLSTLLLDAWPVVYSKRAERSDTNGMFAMGCYFKGKKAPSSISFVTSANLPKVSATGQRSWLNIKGWLWPSELSESAKVTTQVQNVIQEMRAEIVDMISWDPSLCVTINNWKVATSRIKVLADMMIEYYETRSKMEFFYLSKETEEYDIASNGTHFKNRIYNSTLVVDNMHAKRAALPNKFRYLVSTLHAIFSDMNVDPALHYPMLKCLDSVVGNDMDITTFNAVYESMMRKVLVGDLNGLGSNKTEELWLRDVSDLLMLSTIVRETKKIMDIDMSTFITLEIAPKGDTSFPIFSEDIAKRGLKNPSSGKEEWDVYWLSKENNPLRIAQLSEGIVNDSVLNWGQPPVLSGLAEGARECDFTEMNVGELGEMQIQADDNEAKYGILKLNATGYLYIISEYLNNPDLAVFKTVADNNPNSGWIPLKYRLLLGDTLLNGNMIFPVMSKETSSLWVNNEKINLRRVGLRRLSLGIDSESKGANDPYWVLYRIIRDAKMILHSNMWGNNIKTDKLKGIDFQLEIKYMDAVGKVLKLIGIDVSDDRGWANLISQRTIVRGSGRSYLNTWSYGLHLRDLSKIFSFNVGINKTRLKWYVDLKLYRKFLVDRLDLRSFTNERLRTLGNSDNWIAMLWGNDSGNPQKSYADFKKFLNEVLLEKKSSKVIDIQRGYLIIK